VRIGVIGLGWFGEIHCETAIGVPPLNRQRYARERPIA
jgi:UDP-N-acetylglucosamine 3-dehydrogenase